MASSTAASTSTSTGSTQTGGTSTSIGTRGIQTNVGNVPLKQHFEQTLMIEKFDGSNYHTWKSKSLMNLRGNALINITTGLEVKPPLGASQAEKDVWDLKDGKARQQLVLNMIEIQASLFERLLTAHEVWLALEQIYDQSDITSQMGVREKFQD